MVRRYGAVRPHSNNRAGPGPAVDRPALREVEAPSLSELSELRHPHSSTCGQRHTSNHITAIPNFTLNFSMLISFTDISPGTRKLVYETDALACQRYCR